MKASRSPYQTLALMLALVPFAWLAGCKNEASQQPPIPVEQVPRVLSETFKDAKPGTMAAVQAIANSVQAGDPASLAQAHELTSLSELSDEQRAAAFRVAAAIHQKMVENAARGDQKAQEALEHYRATK